MNEELLAMKQRGMSYQEIAAAEGMTYNQVRNRIRRATATHHIRLSASPFPRYDKPLTVEGDALILNDLEVPFHHAEFVNRCLDIAEAWHIPHLILGGDVMHFNTFSHWGAAWQEEKPRVDTLSEATEAEWRAEIAKLPPELQAAWTERLHKLTENREDTDDELKEGARALKTLAQIFGDIWYILGNHDDRFLRRLESPLTPQKLLDFLGLSEKCWHIAPYFRGVLTSGGEAWNIEHQRSASPTAAVKLADKNEGNTIVAHNHIQKMDWSTSGKYYAISSGHSCDEALFPYAMQRASQRPAHSLGAVAVRDGYPWLLHPRVDWKRLMRL